ncbi:L-lactate dehydrogenase [Chelatococcus sp. GCM10030263]|uniref:alpha-hydroxy acid oxidase n=1 Tax=Chelatococcus sp. GCM10030263 TaxID=3273387 RepID=UPI00360822B1
MEPITTIQDLRLLAKRRIPRAIFEYADRGSYDERTIAANRADLAALKLRQRVMIDVSQRSLATTIAGEPVTMPLAIAPTGLTGLYHRDGEICGARAAQAAGIPFCLSTMSICSIEDVAAAVAKPFWFQLYVMRDRGFAQSLVERAIAAKCSALVLTLDLQIQGQRHRDIKNGLSIPPRLTLANALDIATKPAWAMGVLFGKRRTFGNLAGRAPGSDSLTTLSQWIAGQFDPSLSWRDVEWIRNIWPGKLILKGVLDVEDAKIAAGTGADAIVVSNHGGRQLDGAVSSISALPGIVEAVGDRTEILFDGGVQSGQDVLKALALGARACLMGKSFLYALGAMGEAGVTKAIDIIRGELDVSMALTGVTDVKSVDRNVLAQSGTGLSGAAASVAAAVATGQPGAQASAAASAA